MNRVQICGKKKWEEIFLYNHTISKSLKKKKKRKRVNSKTRNSRAEE